MAAFAVLAGAVTQRLGSRQCTNNRQGSLQTCTCVLEAVKKSAHVEAVRYRPYTIPLMKMAFKFHELGVGLATTRSLDSAIIAPSLNTANSTISSVGKYLQPRCSLRNPQEQHLQQHEMSHKMMCRQQHMTE